MTATDLRTNDQVSPLATTRSPTFSWHLAPGATESAPSGCRVLVHTKAGALVWDSGHRPGTAQRLVYAGPEFAPDTDYFWQVGLSDGSDTIDRWSARASFGSGLRDEDWQAHWIRRGTPESPGQPEEWALARATVSVAGTLTRARLYASASHHYRVHVNGQEVGNASSFGYPGEGFYNAYDVTTALIGADQATLAATVHWYGPGQGRAAGQPGLLMQLSLRYSDGSSATFGTDASWKITEGPYRQAGFRNDEGDTVEHLDATRMHPGWTRTGFDDGSWPDAVSLGRHPAHPFTRLTAQETTVSEQYRPAVRLLIARDGTLVADFGCVLPARPVVRFNDGRAGVVARLRGGYSLDDSGRVSTSKLQTQGTDLGFPYTLRDGAQEYCAVTHLGLRYLEVAGVDAGTVASVGAVVVHAEHPSRGTLISSNPELNQVLDLLRDSALLGVQEQFVDTPTREKGQFLADAANISYATMTLFGERTFTRKALREFAASARRYWTQPEELGRYNAVYPNGDGKREIPDFSLMMVERSLEYYRQSGDRELMDELYPALRHTADYVLRNVSTTGPTAGLVTELSGGSGPYLHGIVDWPAPGRFGYDMLTAARTTVNAQSYGVLTGVAELARLLDRAEEECAFYEAAAAVNDRLRVNGRLVDGLGADGTPSEHASQHATSFALSTGITPPHLWQSDADILVDLGMGQGPLTVHRLFRALLRAGRTEAVLDLLTNAEQPGWARIIRAGGTFTWEAWELVEGTDYSQSHAWSASVLKEIIEYLVGIRIMEPGAARLLLEPPVCSLEAMRGWVPTQRGDVMLDWRRDGGLFHVEADVPAGTHAVLRLPAATYLVSGPETYVSAPWANLSLGPGHWIVKTARLAV